MPNFPAKTDQELHLTRYISVKRQWEGFHAYENAPDQVAFLRHNHRHMFKMEAQVEVFHDDRELEFFMVAILLDREIIPYINLKSNLGSCEQQAERVLRGLIEAYGDNRFYSVEVSEDGENSGIVNFDPNDN